MGRTIYIDSDFRCHVSNDDGTFTPIETDFFEGKCDAYIEGYRFVPEGKEWTRSDGRVFYGEMVTPAIDCRELISAQIKYEQEIAALNLEALKIMGVVV